ncbi:hypothetical protein I312_103452 [Cryptococcus bacillisporus CA1280]|uniref:Uncharacterized protein n=1 Tax=Cryptococcus bacillisporus CA1280 TaxID=1296109 RepID=A0A0D0VIK1_CRYGA|nr:hypothetical protein I312_03569 [Cryptococcus bacillisporus CA1280]
MSNLVSSTISLTPVLPTPPLTPSASLPASPVSTTTTPTIPATIRIPSFPPSSSYSNSLYPPLKAHLALLHHSTPPPSSPFAPDASFLLTCLMDMTLKTKGKNGFRSIYVTYRPPE